MKLFKHPVVLIWFTIAVAAMFFSVFLSVYTPQGKGDFAVIIGILLAQASGSILFPILVGYFYDKVKERESGETVWQVFKDFSDGGILRIYKDREKDDNNDNADNDLRNAFKNHKKGEIKLVGVTLRVFFQTTSTFYPEINEVLLRGENESSIKLKAIISHPDSNEVKFRADVEEKSLIELKDSTIVREICSSVQYMQKLKGQCWKEEMLEFCFSMSAPYCTAVIFPEKCYYSPNILSDKVPVRLPMIIFKEKSHGYDVINNYFNYLWKKSNSTDKI